MVFVVLKEVQRSERSRSQFFASRQKRSVQPNLWCDKVVQQQEQGFDVSALSGWENQVRSPNFRALFRLGKQDSNPPSKRGLGNLLLIKPKPEMDMKPKTGMNLLMMAFN
jgi:hypothetical protein